MRDEIGELTAEEAVWKAEADRLDGELAEIRTVYEPRLTMLTERLAAAEAAYDEWYEAVEAKQDPLRQQRSRLWDRIYDSMEARGVELPMQVRMTRWMRFMEPVKTPFLDMLKQGGGTDQVKADWGQGEPDND